MKCIDEWSAENFIGVHKSWEDICIDICIMGESIKVNADDHFVLIPLQHELLSKVVSESLFTRRPDH